MFAVGRMALLMLLELVIIIMLKTEVIWSVAGRS